VGEAKQYDAVAAVAEYVILDSRPGIGASGIVMITPILRAAASIRMHFARHDVLQRNDAQIPRAGTEVQFARSQEDLQSIVPHDPYDPRQESRDGNRPGPE